MMNLQFIKSAACYNPLSSKPFQSLFLVNKSWIVCRGLLLSLKKKIIRLGWLPYTLCSTTSHKDWIIPVIEVHIDVSLVVHWGISLAECLLCSFPFNNVVFMYLHSHHTLPLDNHILSRGGAAYSLCAAPPLENMWFDFICDLLNETSVEMIQIWLNVIID